MQLITLIDSLIGWFVRSSVRPFIDSFLRSFIDSLIDSLITRDHHGLHGSAGTVLTAITLSYGKWRNSTPRRIKTPSLVEMKL